MRDTVSAFGRFQIAFLFPIAIAPRVYESPAKRVKKHEPQRARAV
jgi:hypothetical protein